MLWDTKRIYIDQTDTEPSSECSGLANKTWQESQGGKIILVDQYDFLSKKASECRFLWGIKKEKKRQGKFLATSAFLVKTKKCFCKLNPNGE